MLRGFVHPVSTVCILERQWLLQLMAVFSRCYKNTHRLDIIWSIVQPAQASMALSAGRTRLIACRS